MGVYLCARGVEKKPRMKSFYVFVCMYISTIFEFTKQPFTPVHFLKKTTDFNANGICFWTRVLEQEYSVMTILYFRLFCVNPWSVFFFVPPPVMRGKEAGQNICRANDIQCRLHCCSCRWSQYLHTILHSHIPPTFLLQPAVAASESEGRYAAVWYRRCLLEESFIGTGPPAKKRFDFPCGAYSIYKHKMPQFGYTAGRLTFSVEKGAYDTSFSNTEAVWTGILAPSLFLMWMVDSPGFFLFCGLFLKYVEWSIVFSSYFFQQDHRKDSQGLLDRYSRRCLVFFRPMIF